LSHAKVFLGSDANKFGIPTSVSLIAGICPFRSKRLAERPSRWISFSTIKDLPHYLRSLPETQAHSSRWSLYRLTVLGLD